MTTRRLAADALFALRLSALMDSARAATGASRRLMTAAARKDAPR